MSVASDPERIWAQLPARTQARVKEIMKFFYKKFDKDHSGDLDHGELSKVFISMGENVSQERLDVIFSNFDSDGDGKVSLDEFILGTTQYIYLTMYPGEDVEAIMAPKRAPPSKGSGYGALLARATSPTEFTPLTAAPPRLPQSSPPAAGPTVTSTSTSLNSDEPQSNSEAMLETILKSGHGGEATEGGAPGEPVVDHDPPTRDTHGLNAPTEAHGLLSQSTNKRNHISEPLEISINDVEAATGQAELEEDDDDEEEEEEMPEDLLDLPPEEQRRRLLQRSFNMLTLGTLLVV